MTDILTVIDQAVDLHELVARVEARSRRPGMCAYPNGGFESLAKAVAAERRADRERQTGWRPRAFGGQPIRPVLKHPALKGRNLMTVPAGLDAPPEQARFYAALSMTDLHTAGIMPPTGDGSSGERRTRPGGPCRCSLCIVLGDTAEGHAPVADDEFLVDEPGGRRRRGLFASLRAALTRNRP